MKPKTTESPEVRPDNPTLRFSVRVRPAEYGDGQTFMDWRIVIRQGREVVGIEDGPRRATKLRYVSNRAAWQRVRELKLRRLYVVRVTKKHINDGEGRNCNTCAISQALWHNQERMGLPKNDYSFEVDPYGAWTDPRGIVLEANHPKNGEAPERRLPANKLPEVIWNWPRKRWPKDEKWGHDHMVHFAMNFDDWYDAQFESAREYRERTGDDAGKPFKPDPCVFVLDLDAFEKVA